MGRSRASVVPADDTGAWGLRPGRTPRLAMIRGPATKWHATDQSRQIGGYDVGPAPACAWRYRSSSGATCLAWHSGQMLWLKRVPECWLT